MSKPDTTAAVMKHVKAAVRRIDDISKLNVKHSRELRRAESKRIDANRAGDMSAVALANERSINMAAVLAKQVTDSAQTLAIQLQAMEGKLSDRILSLERSQSVDKGSKTGVKDMVGWLFGLAMLIIAALTLIFKK